MGALGPAARDLLPLVQRLTQDAKTRAAGEQAFERVSGSKRGVAPPGGMLLLPGYTHVREQGIDTTVGRIARKGGPRIGYDIGFLAGDKAAEFAERGPLWTKLQVMNGHIVRVTMVSGGYLFATFQDDTANFEASSVRTPEDLADVLLMISTYNPSRR